MSPIMIPAIIPMMVSRAVVGICGTNNPAIAWTIVGRGVVTRGVASIISGGISVGRGIVVTVIGGRVAAIVAVTRAIGVSAGG